jgi:hypothetical protein
MAKITIKTNIDPKEFLGFDLVEGKNSIPDFIAADYWGWGSYPDSITFSKYQGEDTANEYANILVFEAGSTFLTWGFAQRLKNREYFDFIVESSMGLLSGYAPAKTDLGFRILEFVPSVKFEQKRDFATNYQLVSCDSSTEVVKEVWGYACAHGMEVLKIEGRNEWAVPAHNPWFFRTAAEVWLSFQTSTE